MLCIATRTHRTQALPLCAVLFRPSIFHRANLDRQAGFSCPLQLSANKIAIGRVQSNIALDAVSTSVAAQHTTRKQGGILTCISTSMN